jgi:DNA processing protein
MSDLLYKIALTKINGVGSITARQLVSYCGGAKEVFEASKKGLLAIPTIGPVTVEAILTSDALKKAEVELEFIEKHKIQALSYNDAAFPQRLKQQHDCPFLLYYRGNADLNHFRVVGIVGTRKPTPYGEAMCREIIEGLQSYNIMVISGLAYGIDVTAHKKCLELGIHNIGAIAHGFSSMYPSEHRKVAAQMIECGGLITEHTSEVQPDPRHFPMRNRLIAGICDALFVVETANSGGSMITAEIAHSYNKDVFALPGKTKDKYSQGCNLLIKNNKAALIESAEDIAKNMNWELLDEKKVIQTNLFVELNDVENKLVDILKVQGDRSIDELSYVFQLTPSEMASLLLNLEFKGVIKSLPGKRFCML